MNAELGKLKVPDHDSRGREERTGEYHLEFCRGGEVVGLITCYRPNMVLADFYRTSTELISETVARESAKPTLKEGGKCE